jgi:cytochrome c oxidase cbb3-type subunit III
MQVRSLVLLLMGVAIHAQSPGEKPVPKENPYQTEPDIARGKQLFLGHCAPCHGPQGNGGKGANLARPTLPRAADDPSLFRVISNGIPGTEMPGAWEMIDHEVWQVAAYVRTLGRAAVEEPVSGDRFRGEELFRTRGNCLSCHTVGHEGGRVGPTLTDVGYRRGAGFLRQTVLDPGSTIPPGYLYVELVTRNKKRISGIRLSEDTFSIQLRDLSGSLHSFFKSELAELHKDPRHTVMPTLRGAFSGAQVEDLVAYLLSLRGAQ